MKHTSPFTVSFDEADPGGILFFGNYFAIAHRCVERFTRDSGIGWETWFQSPEWAVPLRHVEADYLRPLRPGRDYTAELEVTKLGESSVSFQVTLRDGDAVCSVVRTTHVFANIKTHTKLPIPAKIRAVLETYLNN